jgi:hypothetical protein
MVSAHGVVGAGAGDGEAAGAAPVQRRRAERAGDLDRRLDRDDLRVRVRADPAMSVERVGYGAGDCDDPVTPERAARADRRGDLALR